MTYLTTDVFCKSDIFINVFVGWLEKDEYRIQKKLFTLLFTEQEVHHMTNRGLLIIDSFN